MSSSSPIPERNPELRFDSAAAIDAVVAALEACSVAPAAFSHRAHLAVTMSYLLRYPEADADARLRAGLKRFIAHHGVDGYNETMTEFWLRCVKAALARQDPAGDLPERFAAVMAVCGPSARIYEYYSRERLHSPELREAWGGPDLKPLDF